MKIVITLTIGKCHSPALSELHLKQNLTTEHNCDLKYSLSTYLISLDRHFPSVNKMLPADFSR